MPLPPREYKNAVVAGARGLGVSYNWRGLRGDYQRYLQIARTLDFTPRRGVASVPPSRPVVGLDKGHLVIGIHAAPRA
jgi:hypothetical protein